ncbi:glycosyltransferase family 2 protein [Limimaricola sp.]|uniref:glycosyltransferase family 2 protein n=1 Tax=Limimaricola sp. TaxID=2211665 RepID=UPI0025BB305D|nr:glycosyltransferase family 2 protein [Limimaricola sp.]
MATLPHPGPKDFRPVCDQGDVPLNGAEQAYDLTIVLVAYNSDRTLAKSLQSLKDFAPQHLRYRLVVVDNNSPDGSANLVEREFPDVTLLRGPTNLGFGGGNNLAMGAYPARYYYLHNTDAYLQQPVLDDVIHALDRATDVGIVGLPLIYPDQSPQTAAYAYSTPAKWALQGLGVSSALKIALRWRVGRHLLAPLARTRMGKTFFRTEAGQRQGPPTNGLTPVDWVCGASLVLRHETFMETGGFDESIFLYGEDEDLCRGAADKGWRIAQIDTFPVVHDFGWGTRKRTSRRVARLKAESLATFIDKHFQRGSPRWMAMHLMLWVKRRSWGA